MRTEEQVPDPHLMDSMRSVGYSLDSALADLVDNSLAAAATDIQISFRASGDDSLIAILDNGRGMDAVEARTALRLAGTNRGQVRASTDLGRFGLGLKTASLSQARVLTLVTKKGGQVTGLEWDLDLLATTGTWSMNVLEDDDMSTLPVFEELRAQEKGTLVLWRNLDLLLGDAVNPATHLAEKMAMAKAHLELVFHRFVSGEPGHPKVAISVNGRPLKRVDPFLEYHGATQLSAAETVGSGSNSITVKAFTLPHLSKLTASDRELGRVGDRMRDSQGFYIYRQRRLIDWGSWFRLTPRDELTKLARVRVDIPNSLDAEWSLDIKKSRAVPPESIKRELRRLIERIVGDSKKVHTYRGRTDESQSDGTYVWELIKGRDSFSYQINRNHPLLKDQPSDVSAPGANLEAMFTLIEETFPVHDVYIRMNGDQQPAPAGLEDEFLLGLARQMWSLLGDDTAGSFDTFCLTIADVEPFSRQPDIASWLKTNEGLIAQA